MKRYVILPRILITALYVTGAVVLVVNTFVCVYDFNSNAK